MPRISRASPTPEEAKPEEAKPEEAKWVPKFTDGFSPPWPTGYAGATPFAPPPAPWCRTIDKTNN